MKKLTFLFILFFGYSFSQTFDIKKMQSFINKTPAELAMFYNTKVESIKDNFGDEKITFEKVKINDQFYFIQVESTSKTIKNITVSVLDNTTNFFKINSEYLESISNKDKIFISLTRNVTGEKKYFKDVNELILNLKEGRYSLDYFTANVNSYSEKISIVIGRNFSFIELK